MHESCYTAGTLEWPSTAFFIDGDIVIADKHSTGGALQDHPGIVNNRGGNTTKIHLVVDSSGFPVYFNYH